jgi:tetratricopeptide (TPR) repeat protein
MNGKRVCALVLGLAWMGWMGWAGAQAPGAAGQATAGKAKMSCAVNRDAPSEAEKALSRDEYQAALDLYAKMAASAPDVSKEGTIRALLGQSKLKAAEDQATAWTAEQPASAAAAAAMAEVQYRRGELPQALRTALEGQKLDPCNPRIYLVASRIQHLVGNYATAKRQIEVAHKLAPEDLEIRQEWIGTLPRAQREEEYAGMLKDQSALSEKDRKELEDSLEHAKNYSKTDCQLTEPVEKTKIPMQPIMDGPNDREGLALDVMFNGKRRRLEIDTGASGILLSRGAASGLGLASEQKLLSGGVGDQGNVATSIAHVQSIRIGNMEFRDCPVELLEKRGRLDIDGLIGGDFFSKYVVTLDFITLNLQLDPMPPRPDEAAKTEVDDNAPVFHDRYTPPAMKDWARVYRQGHMMLIPVSLGKASDKLFLIDTGAGLMSISPAAAREVTKVDGGSDMEVYGISGQVNKVYSTRNFELTFGGLKQRVDSMTAFDTTNISEDVGVEVSGFLGAPVLNRMVLRIDYRDNLVKFDYDASKDPINKMASQY